MSSAMATENKARKRPLYVEIEGIRFDNGFMPSRVVSAMNYEPRDEDIFVATYPKSGTTWMCQIVLLILRRGSEPANSEEYVRYCPFLELHGGQAAASMPETGCIKTHLPFDKIKFSKRAKYIYVARHPRDCAVSFYHHTRVFPNYYFTDGTFDEFFDVFVRGETDFNDYFDNLLSWYEHRHEPNILFMTFESMKADHRGTVLKVARFLGSEHYQAVTENDGELLEKVLELSCFRHMKEVTNPMLMDIFLNVPKDQSGFDEELKQSWKNLSKSMKDGESTVGDFIRTGDTGDGKRVLTPEQERRLKDRISEKTLGSNVMSLWDN